MVLQSTLEHSLPLVPASVYWVMAWGFVCVSDGMASDSGNIGYDGYCAEVVH